MVGRNYQNALIRIKVFDTSIQYRRGNNFDWKKATKHWRAANSHRVNKTVKFHVMRSFELGTMGYKAKTGEHFETEILIDSGASSSTVPMHSSFSMHLEGYVKYAVDDAQRLSLIHISEPTRPY